MNRNEQIAELILEQTYEERVELASFLGDAARGWIAEGNSHTELDTEYFAALLAGWADLQGEEE